MITTLRIKNVALIREAEITLGSGLNILTGETGAGKSIMVDSINFLLGERPARDFIRSGQDSAYVEAFMEISDGSVRNSLNTLGVEISEGQLMLSRTVASQGNKSVCRVNGRTVTVGMLKEISALLVDVHGQHEHQSLLDVNKQLLLLDRFCGSELNVFKTELENALKSYRENGKALKAVSGFGSQRENQIEILNFQLDEIKNAGLKPGEEELLNTRRTRLSRIEKLTKLASSSLSLLGGGENESSALDQIGKALVFLQEIGKLDAEKQQLFENLAEASAIVSDSVSELLSYAEELDCDPNELEQVEERLDLIYRLKKKYGATASDVIAHGKKIAAQLTALVNSEQEINRLRAERKAITREITAVCAKITAVRRKQAAAIQDGITEGLTELGMAHARFMIDVQPKPAFGADGNDRIEFMISPNPGEAMKPLARIASGGEMSRVMLAVKKVLADADQISTLIFDEIDTGVSGRTAQQVAEKLMAISGGKQLLCITHLPQIAAMADTHFLIEKSTDGEKTLTSIHKLGQNEMILELARLIGGAQITDTTRVAAEEMKSLADGLKAVHHLAADIRQCACTR